MGTTLTLLDLAGMAALLLWGVRMVQTGVQRAFGARPRQILGVATVLGRPHQAPRQSVPLIESRTIRAAQVARSTTGNRLK